MHLKNPLLFGLMAILLLGGTISPALSQSVPNLQIVINEVETNPTGSDAGYGDDGSGINSKTSEGSSGGMEYVELYNPTSQYIDIGGWSLAPSATWKTLTISENTIIGPNSFEIFSYVNYWFKDFGETVSLFDNDGNLVDETPLLIDDLDDSSSWQRISDGLKTNSESDWELKRVTPKSSNGKMIETTESSFTFIGQSDKSNYSLGEYVIISGSVSEKLYIEKPIFTTELIKITIQGPSFYKNIALYPDRNLDFSTKLNLQEVYGFQQGEYNIKISYGENNIGTNFTISNTSESISSESETETLEIFTDKESYLPGENVVLSADTTSSIKFGGLHYTVVNPNGKTIFEGTIFPNTEFSVVNQKGGDQLYPFSTQLFMSPVKPVFGTYEINSTFNAQNSYVTSSNALSAKTSFSLLEDEKENVPISLSTDKKAYFADDVIKVTGRSNDVWTEDLEIKVQQTSIYHRTTSTSSDKTTAAINPFQLLDSVRLDGDGRFSFEFQVLDNISNNDDYSHAFGDYRIDVSEYFGNASVIFTIADDPENYVDSRTPLGLTSDKSVVILGTPLKVSGSVLDYDFKVSNNLRNSVELSIKDDTGKSMTYQDHQQKTGYTNCNTNDCAKYDTPLIFTALPDSVGNFEVDIIVHPGQFDFGTYTVTANHYASSTIESITFEVISAQEQIFAETEEQEPLTFEIEKDVYYVGEKLIVTGNVILKDPQSISGSSTSSQTTTNYAQATMNYIEVSIPYPKSMKIVKSSNYQTIPDDDENYTGGGGSGGGGTTQGGVDGKGTSASKNTESNSDRFTGYDGRAILQKQTLLLTDMNFKAYPDENGNFSGMFDLRAGMFASGTYVIKANYYGHHTEQLFTIIDNSLKAGSSPEIILEFDKSEYVPGDTVQISGKIANIYYYDKVSLKISSPDVSKINCLVGHQCGSGNSEKKIRVNEGVEGATFYMNYKIPSDSSAIGNYTVLADTHFGALEKSFFVIDESEIIGQTLPPSEELPSSIIPKKIIEKFNRISDNQIPITLDEKSDENSILAPRVIQGSLFTSARGEESSVNLRITTSDGQCVIGQSSDCLVSESTRKPGAIYSIVTIDDANYKIRYSGNDVRLEKFSIVPEESGSKININNLDVEIIKDEQPSRFYYKISYVALE